jgi:hypothetical protein
MTRLTRNLLAFLVGFALILLLAGCTSTSRTLDDLVTKPSEYRPCVTLADLPSCPSGEYRVVDLQGGASRCVWRASCVRR